MSKNTKEAVKWIVYVGAFLFFIWIMPAMILTLRMK